MEPRDEVLQWLFVHADDEAEALSAARAALDACAWSGSSHIEVEDITHGADVAYLVDAAAGDQIRHVHNLALVCHPDPLLFLAEEHDPRTTWDDGGAQVLFLGAVADIIAGLWTPWSGGYDVTAVRSDFAEVIARLREYPDQQWAIPARIEVVAE